MSEMKIAEAFIKLGWVKSANKKPVVLGEQVFIKHNSSTHVAFDSRSGDNVLKMLGFISRFYDHRLADYFLADGEPCIDTITATFLNLLDDPLEDPYGK